jgi:hypothetical protein
MNISTVIKTNSSYSYLWPIIKDFCSDIPNLKILIDEGSIFNFGENSECIFYDSKLNYTKRLISCLSQIDSDYILLLHDVDLVLNIDQEKIKSYLKLSIDNSIDRISLGVYKGMGDIINLGDISVCKLIPGFSQNFFTPFDYSPSIYNKKSLLDFYSQFPFETYSGLELNPKAQEWINENLKCYGIHFDEKIKCIYHRGFVFTEEFNFLHITVKGKFLPLDFYYDLKDRFLEIVKKYELDNIETEKISYHIHKNTL